MALPTDPATRETSLASENENMKPSGDGRPPRPSTEPTGKAGSQDSAKTATDPGSGAGSDTPPAPNTGPRRDLEDAE